MIRTNILELKPSKFQAKILKEMMYLSSCVYNMANYNVRQKIINQEKVPGFFELRNLLQHKPDYQLLGRSYSSPRLHLYSENTSATFKIIESKSNSKVGLPKYYKNRKTNTTIPSYLVLEGAHYRLDNNKISFPFSHAMRKKYNLKNFKIKYNGTLRWNGSNKRGQIKFKNNKFYLYNSVEVKDIPLVTTAKYASIDMGIKRLFAIKIQDGTEHIIGSKRHFKQWCYYNSLIAKEQSKLALQVPKRYVSKNLFKLYSMRDKFQTNLYNNLVSKVGKVLKRNNVSTVFVGDVEGIREQSSKGAKVNSMLNNYWAYDIIYHKLENKCQELGIKFIKQEESYTSRTCPICSDNSKKNKKDRLFLCSYCGYFDDRDVVGANNILFKGMHDLGLSRSVHLGEIAHLGGICYAN